MMLDMKEFKTGSINGVIVKEIKKYNDDRGWLAELFRHDELDSEYHPTMAYLSETQPGVQRGPHEHEDQADYFCFMGPSDFQMVLWDNRKDSPTFWNKMTFVAGESWPAAVLVPKGVVHTYKNVGKKQGWVFNAPNRLYRGEEKKEKIDEIRHEDDPKTAFKL